MVPSCTWSVCATLMGQRVSSQAGVPGFCDSDGHVGPAVSVRPCLKTHESNNSLNVCPVVEKERDEDVMDDKEEPSEESRPVKGGQSRVMMPTLNDKSMSGHTFLIEVGADTVSLHELTLLKEVEGFQQRSKRTKTRSK